MDINPNPIEDPTEKLIEEPVVEPYEKADEEHEFGPLAELTRRVALAAMGAVALGKDELENFIDKLVERGEIAEKEGRKMMNEVMARRKETVKDAEVNVNRRVTDVLDRMNVATKRDIDELSAKVAMLSQKLDELTRRTPGQ